MRFAVLNTVPPGFCRKMHILAPSGQLSDLAKLTRDDLPRAGLSPTNMEAIQGFVDWHRRDVTPVLALAMWYLETVQRPDGSFLRTHDSPDPSLGVSIRYLQLAGQLGLNRNDAEAIDRAAHWLDSAINDDGLLPLPVSGFVDYGLLARATRGLTSVNPGVSASPAVERAYKALAGVQVGQSVWSTYPDGEPSTGATSLAINTFASCPKSLRPPLDPTWLLEIRNEDGGWGEYAYSPTRIDNTFWAYRACLAAGHHFEPDDAPPHPPPQNPYDETMSLRMSTLLNIETSVDHVAEQVLKACSERADRYAETTLHAIALAEAHTQQQDHDPERAATQQLPIRTPDFLRCEPPLYDQLASIAPRRRWIRLVEQAARIRLAESIIGWLAGLSAAIAILGEELIDGLSALPPAPLIATLVVSGTLTLGWLAVRHNDRRRANGVPHLLGAATLATLLVLTVINPPHVEVGRLPALVLILLLTLVIDVIAVATDQADLLNRLGDE